MTQILTLLDLSGIQSYLFSSNRLRHNRSASHLVALASKDWVEEIGLKHAGDLIYAAGGSAAITFSNIEAAKTFAHDYTCKLLKDAPGLRVVIHHSPFEAGTLARVFSEASGHLAKTKVEQPIGQPLPGLSVTAVCDYTGLPAVKRDRDNGWMSAELACKERWVEAVRAETVAAFAGMLPAGYTFVDDFNELGMHEDSSYMAVIHIDGNGMGERKKTLVKDCVTQANDTRFRQRMAGFSKEIIAANDSTLKETLRQLWSWIQYNEVEDQYVHQDRQSGEKRLKFTPIVTGGDDITLVCDGRLGLSLAALYIKNLGGKKVEGNPYFACAGVAIVGNRFPFTRAYALAEALCKNAKKGLKNELLFAAGGIAMDWHIATSGIAQSLDEIRRQEYKGADGNLFNRPLFLTGTDEWRNWEGFRKVCSEFRDGKWRDKRNKLKALREVLREGGKTTETYREILDLDPFPGLKGATGAEKRGWNAGTCVYFDAIEALDLFEDIEEIK